MKVFLKISVFIFSVFVSYSAVCQEDTTKFRIEPEAVFVGYDISNFLLKALNSARNEYEISIDIGLNKDLFIVGEAGIATYDFSGDKYLYNYSSDGLLWRTGFCYNLYRKGEKNDLMTVGLLFGHANFNHKASDLIIHDILYGEQIISNVRFDDQHVNWLEFAFSLKVELFANIFLGWSIRGKGYLGGSDFDFLKPNVLPGYGNFNRKVNATITYSVFYRIPFHKELH